MSNFIKGFIGYLLFWAIAIITSIVFIHDNNILFSVLLVEIILLLAGLIYVQSRFIGVRQQYTTDRMIASLKAIKMSPISYTDLDKDYKTSDFTLNIVDDVRIYHKLIDKIVTPSYKKPFLISHVWIDKEVPIEQVVNYHQNYSLGKHQDVKIRVGIFVTFYTNSKKDDDFSKTIIYDTTNRLHYYHVPVMITDSKTYLYNSEGYVINKQLVAILKNLNDTIKEKKLEF